MERPNITFVTCYVQFGQIETTGASEDTIRSLNWRIHHFLTIAQTGVPFCVFACPYSIDHIRRECDAARLTNVRLYPVDLAQCVLYNLCLNPLHSLPPHRSESKDTREYMALMNTKAEFLHRATQLDPFRTPGFAWIDFSIAYIFKQPVQTCAAITARSFCPIDENTPLYIAGCLDKIKDEKITGADLPHLWNWVYWRFCGGYLVGGKKAVRDFYELSVAHLPVFLKRGLAWEVNFWAWLELERCGWTPIWVKADHDDSIIIQCDSVSGV